MKTVVVVLVQGATIGDSLTSVHYELFTAGKNNPLVVIFKTGSEIYVMFWPETLASWAINPDGIITDFCKEFQVKRESVVFCSHSEDTSHPMFLVDRLVIKMSIYDAFRITTDGSLAPWRANLMEFFGKL